MSSGHRLVLDLQGAQDPRNGQRGIGRSAAELARALLARPGLVAATVLNPMLPVPAHLGRDLLESARLHWNTAEALARARREGPIAYHLMSPLELGTPGPVAIPQHALDPELALLATLHDLIPLHQPDRLLEPGFGRRYRQRLELVRRCDLLLCVSEATRHDAVRLLPVPAQRCRVIGGGASAWFRPAAPGSDPQTTVRRELPEVRRETVLCVSGGDERKNTERLIRAYAGLPTGIRRSHQLLVVCELDPGIGAAWRSCARAAGLAPDELILTGFVSDELLLAVTQAAALVVAPSLLEGYGLPAAEAVACGRPLITSSTGALPEILSFPPSTFDPRDERELSQVMGRALTDPDLRAGLLAAGERAAGGLDWGTVADRVQSALDELPKAPRRSWRHRPRRPRLALVGPLPPTPSGIADYNARVCAQLARRADLDVLIPASAGRPRAGRAEALGYRQFPAEALGRTLNPYAYDGLLYTFGNSGHHLSTYELALRFPGLVWLHDVRLGAFHSAHAEARHPDRPDGWIRDELRAVYGSRLPDLDSVPSPRDREWQHKRGIFLSRTLVRAARAVLVNSDFAAQLCRLDQGPDAPPSRIVRLPFVAPEPGPDPEGAVRERGRPLIVSFGTVDPIKAPERLLQAVAGIRPRIQARLVLVGIYDPGYRAHLEALARELGLGADLEFTGAVDAETWWRWQRQAAVSVQLRRLTNGETSGSIADAQSVATPVITNMANAAFDYPNDAALVIDNRLLPDELERALAGLLLEPELWNRFSRGALRHARTWTPPTIVEPLLAAIEAVRA